MPTWCNSLACVLVLLPELVSLHTAACVLSTRYWSWTFRNSMSGVNVSSSIALCRLYGIWLNFTKSQDTFYTLVIDVFIPDGILLHSSNELVILLYFSAYVYEPETGISTAWWHSREYYSLYNKYLLSVFYTLVNFIYPCNLVFQYNMLTDS